VILEYFAEMRSDKRMEYFAEMREKGFMPSRGVCMIVVSALALEWRFPHEVSVTCLSDAL
jgi:hypothetical protein